MRRRRRARPARHSSRPSRAPAASPPAQPPDRPLRVSEGDREEQQPPSRRLAAAPTCVQGNAMSSDRQPSSGAEDTLETSVKAGASHSAAEGAGHRPLQITDA